MKIENYYYVYTYTDPRNSEIFYVGKGKNHRDTEHLRSVINNWSLSKSYNKRKDERIKSILSENREPIVQRVFQNLTNLEAHRLEENLISDLGVIEDQGQLLNYFRRYKLTDSDKDQISESLKKYYENNDVWNKGKEFSEDIKHKQSESRKRFFDKGGLNSNTKVWVTPYGEFISRSKAVEATGLTAKQLNKRCSEYNLKEITTQSAVQIKDFDAKNFIGYTWKELGYSTKEPPA